MSPLDVLRAVRDALVARGEPATIEGGHLYVGDHWVARENGPHVCIRGVLGTDDRYAMPPMYRTPTGKPEQVAEIVVAIDERQEARAAGEVSCAA